MDFRIADTFTDSLGRLNAEEQKAAKTTAFDLQVNPANPGLSYHKLEHGKDPRFWSVRVSRDVRIIVHRTDESLLLCYVDHHDKAYQWAERRKLETHPKTGAAQMVVVRESVQEIIVPKFVEASQAPTRKPLLFVNLTEDELLKFGVPLEWLSDVKQADEDSLLVLADHLPAEAAEALLELATGGRPKEAVVETVPANAFDHPDALRRFRTMRDAEELAQALDFPWEKWTVFLHPSQRELVDRSFSGPARVSGSAGTGKTIVALHRAVHLAKEHPEARVLLTTFSEPLAHALHTKLRRLIGNAPRLGERLEVLAMDQVAERLFDRKGGPVSLTSRAWVKQALAESTAKADGGFPLPFLLSEWTEVVDAWQLRTWEDYRDVRRLGRKTRLPESQRRNLWAIFQTVQERMAAEGLRTQAGLYSELAQQMSSRTRPPFDFVVVDEAQDLSIAQLKFLAAMGAGRFDGLFFAGDLGQRIFQQPFSWKALGVDIRGRSRTLHVNYRTSHQIRRQADRLLGPEVSDVDGNIEDRRGTVSVFNGPPPNIESFVTPEEEASKVGAWLAGLAKEGVLPHEMSIFVRSEAEVDRAKAAAKTAGLPWKVLDEHVATAAGHLSICTMHLAKGLEFRAVAVMACDDEIIPLQSRIETVGDESELEEVYNTERQLLYVACTRARDYLIVSSGGPASEFLEDFAT